MESGIKPVHPSFQRGAMGGPPTTAASKPLQDEKVTLESVLPVRTLGTDSGRKEDKQQHFWLTSGGRIQSQNMLRVSRSVFVKIKANTATGQIVVNIL